MVTPDDLNDMLARLWPQDHLRCVELSPTHALAELQLQPDDFRPGKMASGPSQFALADCTFWFLISGALGRVEPMAVTSELSIRFLRPAVGETLFARADLERLGRTQAVATVRVFVDDIAKPTAVAQGTYSLPQAPTA